MASIRTRRRADGGRSYEVRWRLGGTADGPEQSETIRDDKIKARNFKQDVEDAGHQWPAGWVKGVGYVQRAPEPDSEPAQPHLLTDFGRDYVDQLTAVGPDTRSDYESMIGRLAEWLEPIVGGTPNVEELDEVHARKWVNAREAAGAKPKTSPHRRAVRDVQLVTVPQTVRDRHRRRPPVVRDRLERVRSPQAKTYACFTWPSHRQHTTSPGPIVVSPEVRARSPQPRIDERTGAERVRNPDVRSVGSLRQRCTQSPFGGAGRRCGDRRPAPCSPCQQFGARTYALTECESGSLTIGVVAAAVAVAVIQPSSR